MIMELGKCSLAEAIDDPFMHEQMMLPCAAQQRAKEIGKYLANTY